MKKFKSSELENLGNVQGGLFGIRRSVKKENGIKTVTWTRHGRVFKIREIDRT